MAQSAPKTPFRTDPGDELPVGVQLAWRLRALIASGRLVSGERMPSVRALAEWADVNVNTVRGVYARLEQEGIVATLHGRGTFVAARAEGSPEVERIAAAALEEAEEAGVSARDVAIVALVSSALPDALEIELPEAAGEGDLAEPDLDALAAELELSDTWLERDERGARRELRRQVGRLEAELASYRRDIETPNATAARRPAEPRVAGVEELERTRDALLAQLAAARASASRRARRESRAREIRDAMASDPSAHRWDVVSSEDTGEEGCVSWRVEPRFGPLGALMSWWRIKVSGGCPLSGPLAAAAGEG